MRCANGWRRAQRRRESGDCGDSSQPQHHAFYYRLAGFSPCKRVGQSTIRVAVLFSASRAVDGIAVAVTAPATTSARELLQQPVAASKKSQKNGAQPARPREAGTTFLCGASSKRITGAGAATATNDQVRAGDPPIALLALADEVIE
jgi:hypothetical protein